MSELDHVQKLPMMLACERPVFFDITDTSNILDGPESLPAGVTAAPDRVEVWSAGTTGTQNIV